MRRIIALGGNALLKKGQKGTFMEQYNNAIRTARLLSHVLCSEDKIIITHGNGPQVGNLIIQNEYSKEIVPPMPLHVLNAQSQALIGYILQQSIQNILREEKCNRMVITVITQVLVNKNDPAFKNPTKFVGPFYDEETAKRLMEERGWIMKKDPRGGWRRVVLSPKPIDIIEKNVIKENFERGHIVIGVGGGGIPVIMEDGCLKGIDAVIDKDLASALIAKIVNADELVILTDVDYVMINFGKPNQKPIENIDIESLKRLYEEGHFPPGSMGPKVLAAIDFLSNGGKIVRIGSLEKARLVIEGLSGTLIHK